MSTEICCVDCKALLIRSDGVVVLACNHIDSGPWAGDTLCDACLSRRYAPVMRGSQSEAEEREEMAGEADYLAAKLGVIVGKGGES